MELQDILLDESATVNDAIMKLESIRCKVVYITEKGKLCASVTDGDIRRYVLRKGDMNKQVNEVANYNLHSFYIHQKEEIEKVLAETDILSLPIINYNQEVVAVHFKNGKIISRNDKIDCPVVMMAGGKGTRLYPYTKILPKALVPIGESPIAELIIQRFRAYQCEDVFMIINHKKDMIRAYFQYLQVEYRLHFIEEEKFLGTGGGLYFLKDKIDKDFFLINCDIIIDADYKEIYYYHQEQQNYITIIAAKYKSVIPYGVLNFNSEGEYQKMEEKPCTEYSINTGMYVVSHEITNTMEKNEEISFPELIAKSKLKGKKIGVYHIDEKAYMDMGQLEELDKMKKQLNVE